MRVAQTEGIIGADVAEVWEKVCFYEEVKTRPSWFLRMALPLPVRTVGDHKSAGTLCRCEYSDDQYILKRITKSVHNATLEFGVTEASEQFERFISLKGGAIALRTRADGKTRVTMSTNYEAGAALGLFRLLLVDYIIRSMHRFVIKDMARSIERAHAMQTAAG